MKQVRNEHRPIGLKEFKREASVYFALHLKAKASVYFVLHLNAKD